MKKQKNSMEDTVKQCEDKAKQHEEAEKNYMEDTVKQCEDKRNNMKKQKKTKWRTQ